ncbi:uncharacterized protein LOC113316800 isoform X2 [Papaver somniferum]|uniref:uncharacterized protein LOC113316800 isoform X2 n=1 Tax=Papaver somniferum TaxID=3469 RepID=UPI000E6FD02A|nr:uncharacterized protein LOC113316800 isoform X2 [Papaver somniferum]
MTSTIVYRRRKNMASTSNSAAMIGTNSSNFTFPFTNISNFVSAKLGQNNFLLWRDQMESILVSTDLFGYVNGDIVEAIKNVEVDGVLTLNPQWVIWRKIDCFVTSCMKATFIYSVSGDVLGLSTAMEIWAYLEITFRSQLMARKSMLKNQLHNIKKGNLTILVYLQNIKTIADSLAAIGEKMSDSDLVMYVLHGLGREFDTFVVAAQNRETPFTFAELKPRLLNHEQWIIEQHQDSSTIFDQHPTTLYGKNGNGGNNFSGHGRGKPKNNGYGNFKPNNVFHSKSNPGQGSTSGQGNGTGSRRDFSCVDCQICRKKGHYDSRCYFRYHPPTFTNPANEAQHNSTQHAFTSFNEASTSAQHDYDAPSTSYATHWISDSGATAHMTGDANLLHNSSSYKGNDHVQVGNVLSRWV